MNTAKISPVRVEVKLRNNLILKRMETFGIKNVAELCRKAEISNTKLGNIINMKELPVNKDGSWKTIITKLADFLFCLPEDLFSKEQLTTCLTINHAHFELTFDSMFDLIRNDSVNASSPEIAYERLELANVVLKALNNFPVDYEQVKQVLCMLFGLCDHRDHSVEEIAQSLNITRKQVCDIVQKGMLMLRHPARSEDLRAFVNTR